MGNVDSDASRVLDETPNELAAYVQSPENAPHEKNSYTFTLTELAVGGTSSTSTKTC